MISEGAFIPSKLTRNWRGNRGLPSPSSITGNGT